MKLARLSLVGCAVFTVSSCVGPDGQMLPMGDLGSLASGLGQGSFSPPPTDYQQGGYDQNRQPQSYPQQQDSAPSRSPWSSSPQQRSSPPPQQSRSTPPPTSDYLPHLRDEYRAGYDIGAKDHSLGYLSDPKRGYTRFGHGFETYFNEGYSDGFNGGQMRH